MKTELAITVHPLRHVYFIADDDLVQFNKVASFCCTQWGGMNNLIIPINTLTTMDDMSSKEHWFSLLLQRHNPDIFINALPNDGQACSMWQWFETELAHNFSRKQILSWETFYQEDQSLHPLEILSDAERFKRFSLSHAVFLNSEPPPSDFIWAAKTATFGTIWPGQEQVYGSTYELQNFLISSLQEAMLRQQMSLDPYASIVNLTLKELSNLGTVSLFPSLHFDVVVAQNVEDLCRFWNLRAFAFGHHWLPDRRVLLLTKEQFFKKNYFSLLFQLIREKRNYPPYLAEMIQQRSQQQDVQAQILRVHLDVVFHHSYDEEISRFLQSQQSLKRSSGRAFTTTRDDLGREVNEEILPEGEHPLFYMENLIDEPPVYREYGGKRSFLSLEVAEGENSLLVPKAGPSTSSNRMVKVGIQSPLWEEYLPHPAVADLIIPHASFEVLSNDYNPMLIYMSQIAPDEIQRISLTLPTQWQMYQAYFQTWGYAVSASDKMIYANGLLDRAGGLEKAEILRSRTAYNILDMLTMRATQKLAQEIMRQVKKELSTINVSEEEIVQIIASSGFLPQFQRKPKILSDIRSHLKKTSEKKECLDSLAALVKIKAIQRGLMIVCPRCGTAIWYDLGVLDEQIKCLGCLEYFDMPLRETPLSPIDQSLQYSLNPLTDRAMAQDVLPVIIALLTLRTQHQAFTHEVPGMAFKKSGAINTEGDFDFVYVYKHHLYGGECKAGSILGTKDIQTARLARQLGFCVFFFVTIGTFSAESKRLINDFQHELKSEPSTNPPFSIFLLEEQELFGGKLLSDISSLGSS